MNRHQTLPILFEDAEALVIDKPAGLAGEAPRKGDVSVEEMLPDLRLGFFRRPAFAHRLDRDTSGCLLLARTPKALKRFMAAFETRDVEKSYLAIVEGVPADAEGVIDLALDKVSGRAAGWRIVADPRGKPALTRWRTLAVHDGRALLLLEPETGRTHQLRVHMATGLGMAIVGDPMYGKPNGLGMMLHAWRLRVPRPGDKPPVEAEAPFPQRFRALGFALQPDDADA
jgi:tRNA pseudouridine32 synthase / 23S rRNA pseudouridine746 synthase